MAAKKRKKAKRKTVKKKAKQTDFMEVGKEVVPGMRLRCICRGHQGTIGRIAWSPCGRFIASPSADKTIRIWDAKNGECLKVLRQHDEETYELAWSPEGEVLASAFGGTIAVWNTKSYGLTKKWDGHSAIVRCLLWSPDGTRLASGSDDKTIAIWGRRRWEKVATLRGHSAIVTGCAWSPNGEAFVSSSAVGDNSLRLWNLETGSSTGTLVGHSAGVYCVSWSPNNIDVASGSGDKAIRIWNSETCTTTQVLEGHTGFVADVQYSPEGRVLISKGLDDNLRLWDVQTGRKIGTVAEYCSGWDWGKIALHPDSTSLATTDRTVIRIWELDVEVLIGGLVAVDRTLLYTSAKIVFVGESNVGKSCLAMRLAEDRYPEDHEHGTTHGMRFWPMEAEELHPAAKPPEGQRRDVVLWDFGGQDEYRLVHQMFLHDTTLALVLIDPTRGRAAMDEARDWNKRLEKHLVKDRAVKLLVGAKVDRKSDLIDHNRIAALCEECGFAAFLDLSAKTGRNTKRLRKLISDALDWDQMAKTSRPELFQHIRDDVEARRKKKQIVLTLGAFKKAIKKSAAKLYEEAAVDAVSDQLAAQGIIVRTKLTGGDEALMLQLPVIERYAGSLIIAARNNPRGVPVLEERLLGATKTIPLPGMTKKERLTPVKERMVLECIVELMIQHGICFRHGGLLVFPTLFPDGGTDDEKLPHSVSLYYDFTGAIDNIYASLVSKLMVSEEFGEGRLRRLRRIRERKTGRLRRPSNQADRRIGPNGSVLLEEDESCSKEPFHSLRRRTSEVARRRHPRISGNEVQMWRRDFRTHRSDTHFCRRKRCGLSDL